MGIFSCKALDHKRMQFTENPTPRNIRKNPSKKERNINLNHSKNTANQVPYEGPTQFPRQATLVRQKI